MTPKTAQTLATSMAIIAGKIATDTLAKYADDPPRYQTVITDKLTKLNRSMLITWNLISDHPSNTPKDPTK